MNRVSMEKNGHMRKCHPTVEERRRKRRRTSPFNLFHGHLAVRTSHSLFLDLSDGLGLLLRLTHQLLEASLRSLIVDLHLLPVQPLQLGHALRALPPCRATVRVNIGAADNFMTRWRWWWWWWWWWWWSSIFNCWCRATVRVNIGAADNFVTRWRWWWWWWWWSSIVDAAPQSELTLVLQTTWRWWWWWWWWWSSIFNCWCHATVIVNIGAADNLMTRWRWWWWWWWWWWPSIFNCWCRAVSIRH